MPIEKKLIPAGLLVLTIFIVILMASSISKVEFQPGTIIADDRGENNLVPIGFPKFSSSIWIYFLICVIWVTVPVTIFLLIKYPDVRKRTIQSLVYVAIYGLILFLFIRKTQEDSPELEEIENKLIDSTIIETQREASEFISSVAETDPNINFILDITLILLIGFLFWYLYRRFIYKPISTTSQLKNEVEGAINEIQSGVDLRNVIIRCYVEMSEILVEKQGLQRNHSMTPREFEFELQEIGLPKKPVQRLTRLFEAVRYGNAQYATDAEQDAIQCLSAIVNACQN